MTIFQLDFKRGLRALLIWTGVIAFMLVISIAVFPQMKSQTAALDEMYAGLGDLTKAFGLDIISMSDLIGFYATECGSVLGIGGGIFAAILGASALAREEKDRTAEFLLSHPISRTRVVGEKLLAVLAQLTVLNIAVCLISLSSFSLINEWPDMGQFFLLHLANFILQIEIASVCFGISAFAPGGAVGIGIGIAATLYFTNIIRNIAEKADFLKFITPFSYSDAANIVPEKKLDLLLIGVGLCYAVMGITAAFAHYEKKDIAA